MTQAPPPPGWYPDQATPGNLRWWDGRQWTPHWQAAPAERNDVAPIELSIDRQDPAKIAQQAQSRTGGPIAGGGGTLFTEPVLVVNQKAKLIEVVNEYAVFDQHGRQLGAVAQIGQSGLAKAARLLTKYDQFFQIRLEVRDHTGNTVMRLHRPAKFIKSRVVVERPDGSPIGEIIQENVFGKIKFGMVANGYQVGSLNAQNWRAWNFAILDHAGNEVAKITKTWAGLASSLFTTADKYVVQFHTRLPDPLLSMVVAAALTVDTALKQDAN